MRRLLVAWLIAHGSTALAASILVVSENDAAREVAAELVEPFGKAKVKLKMAGPQAPATQCLTKSGGERARCLAQAGDTAFVDAVLHLMASSSKGRTSVTFNLLSLDDGKVLKRELATGPSANLAGALKPVVTRLAKLIKPREKTPDPKPEPRVEPTPKRVEPVAEPVKPAPVEPVKPTPAVADAPRQAVVEPVPTVLPDDQAVVERPTSSGSGLRVAAWVSTGGAIAAGIVAATFGGLGLGTKGQLEQNENGISSLSRSQANSLAAQGNTNLSVALGASIGAGVLGVLAAILWSQVP